MQARRRGRKPKVLRIPHDRAAAAAGEGPVSPPPEVAASDHATEHWHATVAALRSVGLWHRADAAVVARYAVTSALYGDCLRDIGRQGLHVVTGTGYRMPSPAATTAIKLANQLLALEQSLGLTPRSRARMKVVTGPEDDSDRLMAKLTGGGRLSSAEWARLAED